MKFKYNQRKYILIAFLVLVAVSLYRQISIKYFPNDFLRTYIVFAVYAALIFTWIKSIYSRIPFKTLKVLLTIEAVTMLLWMFIRFIQETFLTNNIAVLRYTGYFINVPFILIPILGFLATFGIGRGDNYKIPKFLYLLMIPAFIMIALLFKEYDYNFFYYIIESEPQPNIMFHMNIGSYLIWVWVILLVTARIAVIFSRNKRYSDESFINRILPFSEIILAIIFFIPYMANSFYVKTELIELSAGLFFIEFLSWELYIYTGLIPINKEYEMVFDRSTIGMQIIDSNGKVVAKAKNSADLTPEILNKLNKKGEFIDSHGQEFVLQKINSGYAVCQYDVSEIQDIINSLNASSEELKKESLLLSQEIKRGSENAAIKQKNMIYSRLTKEVEHELSLINYLLQNDELPMTQTERFYDICLIGTYIKQRCNLRLIELSEGRIMLENLINSFKDLIKTMREYKIDADIEFLTEDNTSAYFAIACFDAFFFIFEKEKFMPQSIKGTLLCKDKFCIDVKTENKTFAESLENTIKIRTNIKNLSTQKTQGGYRILLGEDNIK